MPTTTTRDTTTITIARSNQPNIRRRGGPMTDGPYCSCLGCLATADVAIEHPEHGRCVVCEDCAAGYMVVHNV